VNLKIARILGIPHLPCHNHNLNLHIQDMYQKDTVLGKLIKKINNLAVSVCRSCTKTTMICGHTEIKPSVKNKTHWYSGWKVVNKQVKNENPLRTMMVEDTHHQYDTETVAASFLQNCTGRDNKLAVKGSTHIQMRGLKKSEGQDCLGTLSGYVSLKDHPMYVCKLGTKVNTHLSTNHGFETGILKIQHGKEEEMTSFEKVACCCLLKPEAAAAAAVAHLHPGRPATAASLFKQQKLKEKRRARDEAVDASKSDYINCDFVLCSAIIDEQLWSKADCVLAKHHSSSAHPSEGHSLFEERNSHLWDKALIWQAISMAKSTEDGCRSG